MRRAAILLLTLTAIPAINAQTLESALRADHIPTDHFTSAELAAHVNATSGTEDSQRYFVYLTVDLQGRLSGAPVMIKYDNATGKLIKRNLKPNAMEDCCGSPLEIDLTKHYLLISFHDSPSAETVLVADKDLTYRRTLYGFGFHEIAPDQVVYVENMVHFAPQHQERLAWADLIRGTVSELYPPQGDRLRDAFAIFNEQHMPSMPECREANDPCEPEIYDEDITFLPEDAPGILAVNVTRAANHDRVITQNDAGVPIETARYLYKLEGANWFYCEQEATPVKLVTRNEVNASQPAAAAATCDPNLPVASDSSGPQNPFSPNAGKLR